MYGSRGTACVTGVGGACGLAATGGTVTQVIFMIVTAVVIIMTGLMLWRLATARRSVLETGAEPPKARRWSIRKGA